MSVKRITCSVCGGDGYVSIETAHNIMGNQYGDTTCRECAGRGYVYEEEKEVAEPVINCPQCDKAHMLNTSMDMVEDAAELDITCFAHGIELDLKATFSVCACGEVVAITLQTERGLTFYTPASEI